MTQHKENARMAFNAPSRGFSLPSVRNYAHLLALTTSATFSTALLAPAIGSPISSEERRRA